MNSINSDDNNELIKDINDNTSEMDVSISDNDNNANGIEDHYSAYYQSYFISDNDYYEEPIYDDAPENAPSDDPADTPDDVVTSATTSANTNTTSATTDTATSNNDNLPTIGTLADYLINPPALSQELIEGVLRCGHKMLISGPSKAGKSFLLMELCVAIAEGIEWLGLKCIQGTVLYINLEIDEASCYDRFAKIYEALGIATTNMKNILIWNLRGFAIPLNMLVPILVNRLKSLNIKIDAIVFDPIYKIITGDENSATAMGEFCNQFDKVCTEIGCSAIYCHHHSKGAQGSKRAMDRPSGSGVFARDPDALLDIIELELSDDIRNNIMDDNASAWRLTTSLREFKNIPPMNFWFEYPIHRIDDKNILAGMPATGTFAAGKQKNSKSKSTGDANTEFRNAFDACNMTGTVTVKSIASYLNLSDKTIYARLSKISEEFSLNNGVISRCRSDDYNKEPKDNN